MRAARSRFRPYRKRRRWRDYLTSALLLGVIALAAAWLSRSSDTVIEGRAVVADGDSLQINGERIRLEGIDAPEFRQTCQITDRPGDCGRQAAAHLRRLIGGRFVQCTGWQIDDYDRLLAVCSAGDTELNRQMVLDGWAVSFGGYEGEEAQARSAGRGLWAGSFERPRDWRREHLGEVTRSQAWSVTQFARLAGNWIDLAARRVMAMVTARQEDGKESAQ